MKKSVFVALFCCITFFCFAQVPPDEDTGKPWEEIVYRTEQGTIPDTDRSYTIEVRFSPYANEAYITYVILDSLYRESDAVYAVRDVARRLVAEFGYDWYSYPSEPILRFDNVRKLARYRANINFRKYLIQKEN